jgi:hypothetical protein
MTSVEQIEKSVNNFLQKKVKFLLDTKTLKEGKILLFCLKDFYCIFTLISEVKNNKKILYEIPYPFNIEVFDEKIVFDYTVDTFCRGDKNLKDIINRIKTKKPFKLFNKKLTILSV